MASLTYLGDSYECSKAIKGADYIHLLDEHGNMVASFDGISDFSGFALSGCDYTVPTTDDNCFVAVVREDGTIGKGSHRCSDIGNGGNAGSNAPHDGGVSLTITANHIFYVANNDCGLVITCDVSALPDGYVGFVHLYGVSNMQGGVSGDINTTSVDGKSINVLHSNQHTYLVVMKPRGGTKLDWCCFNALSGGDSAPVYNGEVEVE